jgi:hypothetical protein
MQLDTLMTALDSITDLGGRVVVASSIEAALDAVKPFSTWPCAAVFGLRENAGQNEMGIGNGPRHRVTVTLRLMTMTRDVTDQRGQAAMAQLDSLRESLKAACLGLLPDTDYEPLEYVGGQMAYAQAGTIAWIDDFQTRYYLIHQPQ